MTFSCCGQESEWFANYHELINLLNICLFRANKYIISGFQINSPFVPILYSNVLLHFGDAPVIYNHVALMSLRTLILLLRCSGRAMWICQALISCQNRRKKNWSISTQSTETHFAYPVRLSQSLCDTLIGREHNKPCLLLFPGVVNNSRRVKQALECGLGEIF